MLEEQHLAQGRGHFGDEDGVARVHERLVREQGYHCRIYAPVGGHRDLLAYLVRRLLEVLDEFELALMSAEKKPDFEKFLRGVELVYAKLVESLKAELHRDWCADDNCEYCSGERFPQ